MSRKELPDRAEVVVLETDLLVIGGGAAGCFAAVRAREINPEVRVTIMEKAHIRRSGCLAAGVNAINAYLNPGETPRSYLEYVKKDSAGLVREDLVYSMAARLNYATGRLDEWGLPFLKDAQGQYVPRGKRSVRINGESIKPILAAAVERARVTVLNRVVATNYLVVEGKVGGAFGFSVRENKFYVIRAKAVICATGGAAGIYKPNNDGSARHKMWYPPHNTGAGLAMGIRAGAEMTSFEMRFIALRVKDLLAPTGTLAQGVKAKQINAMGEEYQQNYGDSSTPMRLYATVREKREGRGPCFLDLTHLSSEDNQKLVEAYLNMCPAMVLKWADEEIEPNHRPVEIEGSEPYVVGGHGLAGYWVDVRRQTTLEGLYAAGDVAGGAPKKYVTGSMVEGEIAVTAALEYISGQALVIVPAEAVQREVERVYRPLTKPGGLSPEELEERLQKIMDEYAGGISCHYEVYETMLTEGRRLLEQLWHDLSLGGAADLHGLMSYHEVVDRVQVARVLIEHLLYRQETRWRCYQERVDYPQRDDHNWLLFVNSVAEGNGEDIKILEREYVRLGDVYDSTH